MTFEQSDINRNQEAEKKNKKNLEKTEQFLLEKQILRESSDLLQKLASDISKEFGISISEVKNIISWTATNSLDDLKLKISGNTEWINFSELLQAISNAKKSIENASKNYREDLKKSLERSDFSPENFNKFTSDFIMPKNISERWKNPKSVTDQVLWVGIWLIDSSEAVILFTYGLWKWILFTPYHLYLMITQKWELNL